MKIQCEIWKAVPDRVQEGNFVTYELEAEPNDTVLDALVSIYQQYDPTLSFRYACGVARCGECAMLINGEPHMACDKAVEPSLRIEPLPWLPLIKDTVIDRRYLFVHIREMLPKAEEVPDREAHFQVMGEALLHTEIENSIRLTTCFECFICQSSCPRYQAGSEAFPGPLGLLMLAQMRENPLQVPLTQAQVEQMTAFCMRCGKCVKSCPAAQKPLELGLALLNTPPRRYMRLTVRDRASVTLHTQKLTEGELPPPAHDTGLWLP